MEVQRTDHEITIEVWKVRNSNGFFELGANYLGKFLDELSGNRPKTIEYKGDKLPESYEDKYSELVAASRGRIEKKLNSFGITLDSSFSINTWMELISSGINHSQKAALVTIISQQILSSTLIREKKFNS